MLSICIPVYNYEITDLVSALRTQGEKLSIPYELILVDDGSTEYKEVNKAACSDLCYIALEKNIGRAKIRNLFLGYATFPYLLFLDCDSMVENPDFLANYAAILAEKPKIVCGGSIYDYTNPPREQKLRLKNGYYRESQAAAQRKKSPHASFLTNNFLIHKDIFSIIRFDERLTEYGHEDTLFGHALKQHQIEILHVDNVVLNGNIDTNVAYLEKTKKSIKNLVHILSYTEHDPAFIANISLLRVYFKIQKIENLFYFVFRLTAPIMRYLFLRGIIQLYVFDFYKLGVFISIKKKLRL
jgi:glycosyltransferase involved in cell wall biosynthesis